jgi:hypothetical protein
MKALTVTASVILSVLLLAIAWFALFPGQGAGDASVTVAVTPPPPPPAAPPQPAAPQISLPPGFGIAGPQQQGQPPALPQSAPGSPQPSHRE